MSTLDLAEASKAPEKAAAPAAAAQAEAPDPRKNLNYPLVRFSDMTEELRIETVEMVVTAVEKHQSNYEAAARMVKEIMDKKCGSSWHVVVGEGFAFEITHETRNLLYMFFGGYLGILVWKAS